MMMKCSFIIVVIVVILGCRSLSWSRARCLRSQAHYFQRWKMEGEVCFARRRAALAHGGKANIDILKWAVNVETGDTHALILCSSLSQLSL
jgi:hypothetical protein